MEITKTADGEKVTLAMTGRIDTVTAPELQTALTEALSEAATVELDFEGIAYVSSAGLRVLLTGEKSAKAQGKTMRLRNISDDVREVFEITGFTGILTIV